MDPRIEKMLAAHGDLALLDRVLRAAETFPNLVGLMQHGYCEGLTCGGVFECAHCGTPLLPPWHPDVDPEAYLADDERPHLLFTVTKGETCFLCSSCFNRGMAAWSKVGDGDLTAEEKALLGYLRADTLVAARVGLPGQAICASGDLSASEIEYLEGVLDEDSGNDELLGES